MKYRRTSSGRKGDVTHFLYIAYPQIKIHTVKLICGLGLAMTYFAAEQKNVQKCELTNFPHISHSGVHVHVVRLTQSTQPTQLTAHIPCGASGG